MAPRSEFTACREKDGRRRPRGYADWRPQAKTRTLIGSVHEVLYEYEDHLPLTVRQIFYRLVGSAGYAKSEAAYARLSEALVRARRASLIPFDSIRDDGVVTYSSRWHADPDDFWDDTGRRAREYRRDRQEGQDHRIELWCEAAGMAPQLARVADEFSVPVFSAGGFASLSATHLIARRALDREVPTILLHVGDLDPSGESIFSAMVEDAAAFVEDDRIIGSQSIEGVRLALTPEQVDLHGLPTAPAKRSDSRSAGWRGETCQLEALAPDVLAGLVREAIAARLSAETFDAQVEAEHSDRTALLHALPSGEAPA